MSERNDLPDWFDDTFIITLIGLIGGGCGYFLIFLLKSRCTNIEVCCIKCDREPLPATTTVTIDPSAI